MVFHFNNFVIALTSVPFGVLTNMMFGSRFVGVNYTKYHPDRVLLHMIVAEAAVHNVITFFHNRCTVRDLMVLKSNCMLHLLDLIHDKLVRFR